MVTLLAIIIIYLTCTYVLEFLDIVGSILLNCDLKLVVNRTPYQSNHTIPYILTRYKNPRSNDPTEVQPIKNRTALV
jgi:hypothetical protein